MPNSNSPQNNQSKTSQESWKPDKIWNVVHDIQDSPKIGLLSLLTALLARLLMHSSVEDMETSEPSFPEKVKQSKDIIELMLQDATAFCDDESNVRATGIKKHLRGYRLQKNDKDRPATLCSALNIILSEYRDKQFGDLPAPSQHDKEEELIFIPNDPAALESDHIAQHMPRLKRRPEVLATYTSTLRENFECHKNAGFEDWVQICSDDKCAGPSGSTGRLRWSDMHQPWEVNAIGPVGAAAPKQNNPKIEKAFLASKSQERSTSSQKRNSLKRRSEEEPLRMSKKARVESTKNSHLYSPLPWDAKLSSLPSITS